MLPTKFWFIWPSGFRGEDLKKLVNQKQELPVSNFSFNFDKKKIVVEWIVSSMVCWRISSIFYGGSFGRAVSEEKILKNWSIRNKNCLWWP
jgi:hypothetical protein